MNTGRAWLRRATRVGLIAASTLGAVACDDEGTRTIDPGDATLTDLAVRLDDGIRPDLAPDAAPVLDLAVDSAVVDATPVDMLLPDQSPPDMDLRAACENGADDDGDGLIDYPLDRGCASATDDDETEPGTYACANGADDDGDGQIDHPADPGCASPDDPAEDSLCGDHVVRDITDIGRVTGTTVGQPSVFETTCRANFAPEQVFLFTLRHPVARLVFSTTGTEFDTLLDVRQGCLPDAASIACNDDRVVGDRTSEVVIEAPAPGDYFVVLDGFRDEQGPYVLTVRAELADGAECMSPPAPAPPPPLPDAGLDAGLDLGVDADTDAGPPVETPPPALRCAFGRACVDDRCAPAACANGFDDDADGRTDHPEDPGCTSPDDNDETSPDPLPQCANGRDDDFDGQTDFPNDPDCIDAADDNETRPAACQDRIDNDGDGLIDLADPGCRNDPNRVSEFNLEACRDSVDNDADGLTDYPNDPGCTDRLDPDETDPVVPAACSNGVDDDADGQLDFPNDADSCFSAADPSEDDPCTRRVPQAITGLRDVRGTTRGLDNDFSPSCGRFNNRDQTDGEVLLRWDVAADRTLVGMTLNTRGSDFDTILSVSDRCAVAEAELACDDDSGPEQGTSFITLGPQAPGTSLFIVVDGGFAGAEGLYRLRVIPQLALGANCGPPGEWTCGPGTECQAQGAAMTCVRTACGNGRDDDNDGWIDYPLDPGCVDLSDPDETDPAVPPACSNFIDDDGDGQIDYGNDPDCVAASDNAEGPACGDRLDNDGDGLIDLVDRGCACNTDPSEEVQPQCADHCDNDRDGLIDAADPGCEGPEDDNEFHTPQCRDGLDNDGNGRIDFPADPGCVSIEDAIERLEGPAPACANGVDDDGDGRIDYAADGTGDDGCAFAAETDEAGPCDQLQPLLPPSGMASGSTLGLPAGAHVGQCALGDAPEAVFRTELRYPALVRVRTAGSNFDTVAYARSTCGPRTLCPPAGTGDGSPCQSVSTQLACNDNINGPQSEALFDWPGGPFHVFVDGFDAARGNYVLTVTALYVEGGGCDPDGPIWATCPAGTACLPTEPTPPDAGVEDLGVDSGADAGLGLGADLGADAGIDLGADASDDLGAPDLGIGDAEAPDVGIVEPEGPAFTCQPSP